jgi:hypothetical protein
MMALPGLQRPAILRKHWDKAGISDKCFKANYLVAGVNEATEASA